MATDSSNAIPTYGEVQNMLQSSTGDLHKWVAWSATRQNLTINSVALREYLTQKVTVLHVINSHLTVNNTERLFGGIIIISPATGAANTPYIIGQYSGDGFDEFFTMGMYNLEADTYSEFFNKQIEE